MWKQLFYFPVGYQLHCSAIIENLVWMRILKFKTWSLASQRQDVHQ